MANKDKAIEAYARNLKASCAFFRVSAIVRVEDVDDIPFWQTMLSAYCPRMSFKFFPYSQSGRKLRVTGKSNLLRYIPFAGSRMLIAIDSDFDYLRQDPRLSASQYLLQTYTYSWENHYCYAPSLQSHWQMHNDCGFSFSEFLKNLSEAIYLPLVILLIHKMQKKGRITLGGMESRILRHQPNREAMLENNGQRLISEIRTDLDDYVSGIKKVKQTTFKQYEKTFNNLGLTQDTAYLYMQGHCIYDLVHRIGGCLDANPDDFKASVLDQALQMGGYPEINKVISDIEKI